MSNKEDFINFNFNTENYDSVDERYCTKSSKAQYFTVDDDVEKECKKKCDSLKENCDALAIGTINKRGKKYNCVTLKNCVLSKEGTSTSYTKSGKIEFFKQKSSKKESISIHIIFLMILVFQMFLMLAYGAMLFAKSFRKNM